MTCTHGEPDPSCCIDCLEGPPAKVAPNLLPSTRERSADYHGRCSRQSQHFIEPGDLIRYTEMGWCCEDCTSPPPPIPHPSPTTPSRTSSFLPMPEPDPVDQAWDAIAAELDTAPQVPQYLTVKDVARLVKVHPDTVRTWAKSGALRGTKVPGQGLWRFARQDVLDFMGAGGGPAPHTCCGCTGRLPSA